MGSLQKVWDLAFFFFPLSMSEHGYVIQGSRGVRKREGKATKNKFSPRIISFTGSIFL